VHHLRALFLKLVVGAAALLACACAGLIDQASAAGMVRLEAPIARIATRAAGKPEHRSHSACSTSHRRGRGHVKCRSHAARASHSHVTRSHLAHRLRADRRPRATTPATVPAPAASEESIIADVLASPCANTELTPEPGNIEVIDAATLCLVNQERARNGELPLQPNAQLAQAAQGHSEEMVSEDYFDHVAPSGLTPVQRVDATGYVPNSEVGYTLGENIAWGTLQLSTPSAIVAAWIASPEHLANILYSPYRDTAIGVAPAAPAALAEGQPGAVYSQEFGVIVE
jgi:uncharacterized protein YkwD